MSAATSNNSRRLCWLLAPLFVAWLGGASISIGAFTPKSTVSEKDPGWPQFRGPTHDAHSAETGLADKWPEEGPPVLWTLELGQGYSSFAAVGEHLFTQTQSLYQQSVVCLDRHTGRAIWMHNYGWPHESAGLYPGPRSTPTWHADRVYFAAPDGLIGCLDAATGRSIWTANPKKAHHGRGTDFGYASSPLLIDGKVIVPVGGIDASVVALDVKDGSTVWTAGESSASYATPFPITLNDRKLVIVPLENSLAAFDIEAGRQDWELDFSHGYDEHSSAPLYREPLLFFASPFRAGAKCYRLTSKPASPNERSREEITSPANALSPEGGIAESPSTDENRPIVVWDQPKFSNDVCSSVLVNGCIYGFDLKDPQSRVDRPSRGEFRCIEFETGRILWSTNQVKQCNLIVADGKLILFTDAGELILARPDPQEYVELARTQVFHDEVCWTSPALHRGCLYLRTQSRAVCLYLGNEPLSRQQTVQRVKDIPHGRITDAKWLIGGEREFPATVPDWSEFRFWYGWSLAGLGLATAVTAIGLATSSLFRRSRHASITSAADLVSPETNPPSRTNHKQATQQVSIMPRGIFWTIVLLVGVVGSPILNQVQSEYVLLWPLVLWAVFQITINLIVWTERHIDRRRYRWLSRGCGATFLATCVLYFHLCRSLGYAIEWSFLVGFLPGFAVAVLSAQLLTRRPRGWLLLDLLVAAVSFSAYFWGSVAFVKWKLTIGT